MLHDLEIEMDVKFLNVTTLDLKKYWLDEPEMRLDRFDF